MNFPCIFDTCNRFHYQNHEKNVVSLILHSNQEQTPTLHIYFVGDT